MMRTIIGGIIMLCSNVAVAGDAFEVVSVKFKDGVSFEVQESLMLTLNEVVHTFEGFKSRDYYYSKDNGRWIDFVVWESVEKAKKASEKAMSNPKAKKVFAQMDNKTMIFSHYERIGGLRK